MVDQLRNFGVGVNQGIAELDRVRSGVADTLNAGNACHQVQQLGKIHDLAEVVGTPVGVHVLPEQVDLAYALAGEVCHFCDDIVDGPRHFFAAGVRHDAERTVLAAALHDRDKGGGPFNTGLWQAIEFFDFREADIDHQGPTGTALLHHRGQPVQGLRPENEVDIRRALADLGPLLAGDAATHADDQVGIFLLQMLPAAQLVENLFLGFFTNRAGIEQQDIRFFRVVRGRETVAGLQQIAHARRVILVHLAAVGLDVQLFAH